MSYYCKKCGAVVVGKFCSCCGQKVKTAFEEFISAKNRQRRAFRRWAEQKDFNRYGCIQLQVAGLAENIAEKRNFPRITPEDFERIGEGRYWRSLVSFNDEMREIYFKLMETIFLDSLAAQLQQASEQCANAMKDLETAQKSAEDLQDESTAELEASIRDAEEINRKVRANLDKARAEDEARSYADQYKALTDSIDAKRQERRALLDGADLPLPGLSVDDGALTYQGKRWGDMSGSDQLRVATAIVRKLNPECGFVLLDKLEQMDLRTLTDFGSWLASEGLQAIATRVSTGGECQIIIEDGRVQGADITPAPQPRQWTKGAF